MKRSQLHQIAGVLVEAGRTDLAKEITSGSMSQTERELAKMFKGKVLGEGEDSMVRFRGRSESSVDKILTSNGWTKKSRGIYLKGKSGLGFVVQGKNVIGFIVNYFG